MISDDKIKKVLKWIKARYDDSITQDVYDDSGTQDIDVARLYSKLAILELSGWVEGSLKYLVLELVDKKLIDDEAKEEFEKIIRGIRGFKYDYHFLDLLNKTIGFINKEAVEKEINNKDYDKLQKFKTALDNLSSKRNLHAHTFSHESQKLSTTVDPAFVIKCYKEILLGLEAFEEEITKNQYIPPASPQNQNTQVSDSDGTITL